MYLSPKKSTFRAEIVTFTLSLRILVLMEDESWVLDSLVGFLRSPVWNRPTFRAEKVTFTLSLRILVLMADESWVLDSHGRVPKESSLE